MVDFIYPLDQGRKSGQKGVRTRKDSSGYGEVVGTRKFMKEV
jgi:hypothetical protein